MKITDAVIEQAIQKLINEFDSHDVIMHIAQNNQRIYAQALSEIDSERPFQKLHTELGRRIKEICEGLGFSSESSRSRDIFGQNSKCLFWSKSGVLIPAPRL